MIKLKKSAGVLSVMFLAMMVVGLAAAVIIVGNMKSPLLPHTKAAGCVENDVNCVNNLNNTTDYCLISSTISKCVNGAWQQTNTCAKGCHYTSAATAVCNKLCVEGTTLCGQTNSANPSVNICRNDEYWVSEDCGSYPNNNCAQRYTCKAVCKSLVNPTPKPQPTTPPVNYTCGGKSYIQCSTGTCPKGQTCKKNDTKKSCNCKSV